MRPIIRVSIGLLLLAVLVGCGKRSKFGEVSGKVTYKGHAVNDASLFLYPAGDTSKDPITIPVDSEGNFRIIDVPKGDYKVVVQGAAGETSDAALLKMLPPDKKAEMAAKMEKRRATIPFPNKYKDPKKTDLRCTITDQNQTLELELKD
jgi:hypothetical protein